MRLYRLNFLKKIPGIWLSWHLPFSWYSLVECVFLYYFERNLGAGSNIVTLLFPYLIHPFRKAHPPPVKGTVKRDLGVAPHGYGALRPSVSSFRDGGGGGCPFSRLCPGDGRQQVFKTLCHLIPAPSCCPELGEERHEGISTTHNPPKWCIIKTRGWSVVVGTFVPTLYVPTFMSVFPCLHIYNIYNLYCQESLHT